MTQRGLSVSWTESLGGTGLGPGRRGKADAQMTRQLGSRLILLPRRIWVSPPPQHTPPGYTCLTLTSVAHPPLSHPGTVPAG